MISSEFDPQFIAISDRIFENIDESDTQNDILKITEEIRKSCNIENITYAMLSAIPKKSKDLPIITTYNEAWQELYLSKNFIKDDPTVSTLFQSALPFEWSDIVCKTPRERLVMDLSREYGVGDAGLSIPLRGLKGELGILTVTSNTTLLPSLKSCYARTFSQVGIYLHEWHARKAGLRARQDIPRLSSREKDCLALCADGLMAQRVSEKLGISEAAIRLYLSSARNKLRSQTTCGAVAKAIRLGII
nr:LuxR family transcriptional regulator [uncultured Acetobacter sp.]